MDSAQGEQPQKCAKQTVNTTLYALSEQTNLNTHVEGRTAPLLDISNSFQKTWPPRDAFQQ